jgi:hypothetical protein
MMIVVTDRVYWIVGLMKPKLADKHRLKIKFNLSMILCCLQNEDMIRLYKEALKFDKNWGSPDSMSRSWTNFTAHIRGTLFDGKRANRCSLLQAIEQRFVVCAWNKKLLDTSA